MPAKTPANSRRWNLAVLVADLVSNGRLGLGPPRIEFKRACLHAVNPAGFGAIVIASTVSVLAFPGLFGAHAEAFSAFVAAGLALLLCPFIARLSCSLDATCGDACRKEQGGGAVVLPTPSARPV
ncbi:hypothetical protein AB0D54_09630 [Streptomyces xanthophaeus]|uniref:hypothetical protein n=1 Tax=Streptomyces xanthophaeus TaxID=67385 RepID=UPI0034496281